VTDALGRRTLSDMQRTLESLYGVDTSMDVGDFVIDDETRKSLGPARAPREQLLLREAGGELEIALFVDPAALESLGGGDPARGPGEHNLGEFCLVLEGVSHFVYTVLHAKAGTPLSAFELELQAEVDKFATCALAATARGEGGQVGRLRERLFADIELLDDLDPEERRRYRSANHHAARFARTLEHRYLRAGRISRMVAELRRFYRLSSRGKIDHIARAA
jgi:hypothetical protein